MSGDIKISTLLRKVAVESILCCVLSHLSCVHLFCEPMDLSLPGSSVHGILQARVLEWVAMPSSRGYSPPRVRITYVSYVSCIDRRVLYYWGHLEALKDINKTQIQHSLK